MTKTRSMMAKDEVKLGADLQSSSLKISKDKRTTPAKNGNLDSTKQPTTASKGKASAKGRGGAKKDTEDKKEIKYDTNLVNFNLIKKFDTEAMLEQIGNQHGDCHLPRGKLISSIQN